MKPDYTAIQQHYKIRENRYKEQIKSLENSLNEKDVIIAELNIELTRSRCECNRLSERLDRLLVYTKNATEENKQFPYKKSMWGRFKLMFHKKS